jgi:hypothetical protein
MNSVIYIMIVVLLVIALPLGMGIRAETLKVKLEAGEYHWELGTDKGDNLIAPQFGMINNPGKPRMPSKIFYIAVPPDAEISIVSFSGNARELDGIYNIESAELALPAREFTNEEYNAAKKERDANYNQIYSSNNPFPSVFAENLGTGGFRKYRFLQIRYSPWQYCPKSMKIQFTPEIQVSIEYKRLGKLDNNLKLYDTGNEDTARELILNYGDAQKWYPPTPKPLDASDYRYVIMCTDATRDAVEPLVNWKESIGMRVHVFTKEWLEANTAYPSYELERQIRYYLRDNYLTWGAEYFLIVADTDIIPMRECNAEDGGGRISFTDSYYGELSDIDSYSWDDDWDGFYGECTHDTIDWALELAVGRIPDNNPATVQAICEKIRTYEMDTGSWKKRSLMCAPMWAYSTGSATDHAYVAENMMSDWTWSGWFHYTMYEKEGLSPSTFPSTSPLTKEMLLAVWDNGQYALVNFGGHGYTNGSGVVRKVWDTDDGDGVPEDSEISAPAYFQTSDIPGLDDNHPSIVIFADCDCGLYNSPNAVAKEILHNGGVATVSAAGYIVFIYNWQDETAGGIQSFQYLWNKRHIASGMNVGNALASALNDYATNFSDASYNQQILLHMTLYGDPSLLRSGTLYRSNLDYYCPAEWHYGIVPRSANDATSTWCPVSSTLPGNSNSTYLNFGIQNNGNITAYDVLNNLYVDDVFVKWASWGWIGNGVSTTYPNIGPFTVRGGRHTVKVSYDPDNELTESNESDNVWQRQYVWSPYALTNHVPLYRTPPPDRGTGTYYNCDGFSAQLDAGEYWCAVGIIPYIASDNYDIRLHTEYTGSTDGFDTYHKWSANPGDYTDFCIANRHVTGSAGPYYFGVIKMSGGTYGFRIQQSNSSTGLSRTATNGPFTIHAYDVVDMYDVYLTPAAWRISLDVVSGTANLGLSMYDKSGDYFSKSNYKAGCYSNSGGNGEDESFDITITEAGYYGIAVWKNNSEGYGYSNTYYLSINDDLDEDGMPDPWEITYFGDTSQSAGGDYDHDGRTNLEEYESGTIPNDPDSFFDIIDIKKDPKGTISIFWNCIGRKTYCVYYSNDNMGSSMTWIVAEDNILATNSGVHEWIDDGTLTGSSPFTVQHRYYKVMVYGAHD